MLVYGEHPYLGHRSTRRARSAQLWGLHGMEVESRRSSLLRVIHDVLVVRRQVLWASLCLSLSLRREDVVCLCCAPQGRSCTLSSGECNSSNGLVDHPVLKDIEFCDVYSDLSSSVASL